MSWTGVWSIKVDGTELNTAPTGGSFIAEIPEIEDIAQMDVVSVAIDGSYPAFIRLQPREGTWTLNIAMKPCSWATWQTNLATLSAILTPGVHTLTVQIRGQSSPLSTTIVVKGRMTAPKQRALSYTLFVPKPVLA